MRQLAALLIALLVAVPSPSVRAAVEKGRLIGVRVRAEADSSVIELQADRPLSFTTLKLASPPRVVVDFAEATLDGAPRELTVDDGTVRRVGTAAAGSRTARVVIELAGEADFDVRAEGNRLDVRVPRLQPLKPSVAQAAVPEAAPETAAPKTDEPAAPEAVAAAPKTDEPAAPEAVAAAPKTEEPAAAPPVAKPAPEGTPRTLARVDAPGKSSSAAVDGDRRVEASSSSALSRLDSQGRASASSAAEPGVTASSSASLDRLDPSGQASATAAAPDEREAHGTADRPKPAPAVEHRPKLPTVSLQGRSRGSGPPPPVAPHPAEEPPVARAEPIREEPKPVARAAPAQEERDVPPPEPPVGNGLSEAVPPPPLEAANSPTGSLRVPAPARTPPAAETPARSRPRKVAAVRLQRSAIHGIGFRPTAGGVVIIRSDRPVQYTVSAGDHEVILHLAGASIPLPNNRRPLDTSVFGGPVLRVLPRMVRDGVDLHVQLRKVTEFHVEQSGAVLTVTFVPAG